MAKKMIRYRMVFHAKQGCSLGVIQEMARYDSASVWGASLTKRHPDAHGYSSVVLEGPALPTMGRWRSFAVGAECIPLTKQETE